MTDGADGAGADQGERRADGAEPDADELRNALPQRVEAWRRRTVTGAMLTGIARGLGQVFEPERERAAIVAEMPGAPPPPPGPVEAQIDPDDPEASRLIVRRWMLEENGVTDDSAGGTTDA